MAMFGDGNKQNIYEELKEYFDNGGTLQELFDVLSTLCEYRSENIKVGEQ